MFDYSVWVNAIYDVHNLLRHAQISPDTYPKLIKLMARTIHREPRKKGKKGKDSWVPCAFCEAWSPGAGGSHQQANCWHGGAATVLGVSLNQSAKVLALETGFARVSEIAERESLRTYARA